MIATCSICDDPAVFGLCETHRAEQNNKIEIWHANSAPAEYHTIGDPDDRDWVVVVHPGAASDLLWKAEQIVDTLEVCWQERHHLADGRIVFVTGHA